MNERDRLEEARKNLGVSFRAFGDNLKLYGTAKVDYEKARLGTVGKGIVDSFKKLKGSIQKFLSKKKEETKELSVERNDVIEAEFEEAAEELDDVTELEGTDVVEVGPIIEETDVVETDYTEVSEELDLEEDTVQQTNTFRSKLGTIKNDFLKKLKSLRGNWDLKFKNAFEQIGITATNVATATVGAINKAKTGVTKFTSEQIEKYRVWKEERAKKKEESTVEATDVVETEPTVEATDVVETEPTDLGEEQLNLEENTVQQTNTFRSKLGTIKNDFLKKLKSLRGNWDLKFKNAFEQIGITATNVATATVGAVNKAKTGVTKFTSEQIEKYRAWRIESQEKRLEKKQKRDEELAAEREVLLQKNRELAERLKEAKEKLMAEMAKFKGEEELQPLEAVSVR